MEVIYEKDLDFIRPIECIYQYKNAFILYTMQSGKLWKWSHKTKKYIEIADMEEEYQTWLFVTCIEVDEVLYFVPYLAKYMIEYHLKTGKIDRVFCEVTLQRLCIIKRYITMEEYFFFRL